MSPKHNQFDKFPFAEKYFASLVICCAGFEDRVRAFPRKLRKVNCVFQDTILLRYAGQNPKNENNFQWLKGRLTRLTDKTPQITLVDSSRSQEALQKIKISIETLSRRSAPRVAIVDVTGMTHLISIAVIHTCVSCGYRVKIVYTEATEYFPSKDESRTLVRTWQQHDYRQAERFLQSAALKSVDILQEFQGNSRPGRPLCLLVFAGYEPNRLEGLVNLYAPGALIVVYGKSPHRKHHWRTELSKALHKDLFSGWLLREMETSTIDLAKVLKALEDVFSVIKDRYDFAITPHCSKMQGVATYLFWRNHPEVQIVFTSPVRFNSNRYSVGSGKTFLFDLENF